MSGSSAQKRAFPQGPRRLAPPMREQGSASVRPGSASQRSPTRQGPGPSNPAWPTTPARAAAAETGYARRRGPRLGGRAEAALPPLLRAHGPNGGAGRGGAGQAGEAPEAGRPGVGGGEGGPCARDEGRGPPAWGKGGHRVPVAAGAATHPLRRRALPPAARGRWRPRGRGGGGRGGGARRASALLPRLGAPEPAPPR